MIAKERQVTEDEQTLLLIKGAISELPAVQQSAVHACAQDLRDRIRLAEAADEALGTLAFALVGAEVQLGALLQAKEPRA